VQALRDLYRADVVTILTSDNDACGLGYLMGPSLVNSAFEPYAYNVVLWSCANGNLSMAHEIGHNMGLNHDRANAGGSPAFDYAYGYAVSGLARDVMAYPCASNCPRLAIYSTPLYNFPGTATTAGTATEDNARALDNTSLVVANFRQSCSYSLAAASASFGEGGGGGSVGLTATAGCAWTATSNDGFLTVSPATASGSGSQTINFSVAANVGAVNVTTATRVGSLTIAGLAFSVTQTGCGFAISPSGKAFGAAGGSGTVGVTTPVSCTWSVTNLPAWVTTSSGGSGTGSGTWNYTVAVNGGAARNATVRVASLTGNFTFAQFAAGVNPKVMTAGTRSRFTIADNTSSNLSTLEAVGNRSYCTEVAAAVVESSAATPGIEVFRSDGTTGIANGTRRACFVAPFTETTVVAVTQSEATPRSHVLRIHETTLWANWFFTGGDYSSFTLLRNTTNGVIHATLVWRDLAGTQRGSALNITLPAGGDALYDARTQAGVGPGVSGSVEIAYDGETEGLLVSQTTLSAATGLSFDTLARPRAPW
jgi:Metallo-peptidase family M12B Reprolysin-like/Viral BACON domain